MKKMMTIILGLAMVMVASNAYAGGGALARGFVGIVASGVLGEVVDSAGKVIEAGGEELAQKISGRNTFFEGNVKSRTDVEVGSVEAKQDSMVSVGAITVDDTIFKRKVEFSTEVDANKMIADPNSFIDVGSINVNNIKSEGRFDIGTKVEAKGTIRTHSGSVVRLGSFSSY